MMDLCEQIIWILFSSHENLVDADMRDLLNGCGPIHSWTFYFLFSSHENLVDADMRDLLNGSPGEEEEENNRSPLSAEAPELSSHSSDEVPLLIFQAGLLWIRFRIQIRVLKCWMFSFDI